MDDIRQFVNMMIDTAEDLAIAECGKPDDEVLVRLAKLSATLRSQLEPLAGVVLARRMAEAFCATVMGAKKEREALARMGLLA